MKYSKVFLLITILNISLLLQLFSPPVTHAGELKFFLKPIQWVVHAYKFRHLSKVEKILIKNAKKTTHEGKKVFQRNNIFSKNKIDAKGRNNCERILNGLAPLGKDGMPVELHHIGQKEDSMLLEVLNTEHNVHNSDLHNKKIASQISRNKFLSWKKSYWINRWAEICN